MLTARLAEEQAFHSTTWSSSRSGLMPPSSTVLSLRSSWSRSRVSTRTTQSVDTDPGGRTALYWAFRKGHLRVVRWLLARHADPNITSHGGSTPTMRASYCGHLEVVQLLAIHGADIGAANKAARSSAQANNKPTMVRFIDAIEGWTPFRIAIACRFPAADLRRMLQNGTIDPPAPARSPPSSTPPPAPTSSGQASPSLSPPSPSWPERQSQSGRRQRTGSTTPSSGPASRPWSWWLSASAAAMHSPQGWRNISSGCPSG